jgi:cell division protein FtsQ
MKGAMAGVAALPRISLERLVPSPRLRRRLLIGLAVFVIAVSGYVLWLRDSSFVRVERVQVTGLTTDDAVRIRQALTGAAHSMTTLHVDHGRLRQVVSSYPGIRQLEVDADFPHALRIRVVEYRPVAVAVSGHARVALGADGSVLRGAPTVHLPAIRLPGSLPTERLGERGPMTSLRVLAAAPGPLRVRLAGVERLRGKGLVVRMRKGPDLIFGNARRLYAKWEAAARVLADHAARGARYIDLRLPERPAAGGVEATTVAPVAPAAEPPIAPQGSPQATQAAPATPQAGALGSAPAGGAPAATPAPPATSRPADPGPAPAPPPATPGGGATADPQP